MRSDHERTLKLAVLIDTDNASPGSCRDCSRKIAAIGEASVRGICGNLSGTRPKGWADILSTHAIMPHQNVAGTVGGNAWDIALVDARNIPHSDRLPKKSVSADAGTASERPGILKRGRVSENGSAQGPVPFLRGPSHRISTMRSAASQRMDT